MEMKSLVAKFVGMWVILISEQRTLLFREGNPNDLRIPINLDAELVLKIDFSSMEESIVSNYLEVVFSEGLEIDLVDRTTESLKTIGIQAYTIGDGMGYVEKDGNWIWFERWFDREEVAKAIAKLM